MTVQGTIEEVRQANYGFFLAGEWCMGLCQGNDRWDKSKADEKILASFLGRGMVQGSLSVERRMVSFGQGNGGGEPCCSIWDLQFIQVETGR
ncbi:unnamed protein product [Linum trigynum]|uniref:Uncharacterized protein n=1 Tax=Linum trigynum TaxID=586398 RepID=A0AAV2FQ39_9ROSI